MRAIIKWLAGIMGAVIAGLLVWWFTVGQNGRLPWEGFRGPTEPTHRGSSSTTTDAESESKTGHSLPGDTILHFRVVESVGLSLVIEVHYKYNDKHGDKVMAGASLRPKELGSGYRPVYVPTVGSGTVRVPITLYKPGASTHIKIFLYEWGRPAETFAERTFEFRRLFQAN